MFSAIFIIGRHLQIGCHGCTCLRLSFYGAIAFAIGVLAVRAYRRSQSDNFEKRNN